MANQVSINGDVYSYGILLLEMFTGVRPIDEILKDGINLHKFVEMVLPTKVVDVIDPYLLAHDDEVWRQKACQCLVSVLGIGLSCSKESPKERMQMGDVSREMQAIRDRFMKTETREETSKEYQIQDEGPSSRAHYDKSQLRE